MKPMIGIVPLFDGALESYWMLPGYMKMIERCGGAPFMLPLTCDEGLIDECAGRCDGIVFSGGHDVDPREYGQRWMAAADIDICCERDRMERRLLDDVLSHGTPFLGICRGLQLLNVCFGGTLFQSLPLQHASFVNHYAPGSRSAHLVAIDQTTALHDIVDADRLLVNSLHHQAISRLASGLQQTATAEDGLVEGASVSGHPFGMAVQWHPELLFDIDEANARLVESFVAACA